MCSLIAKLAMLSAFAASLQLQQDLPSQVAALEEQVGQLTSTVDHLQKQQVLSDFYHVNENAIELLSNEWTNLERSYTADENQTIEFLVKLDATHAVDPYTILLELDQDTNEVVASSSVTGMSGADNQMVALHWKGKIEGQVHSKFVLRAKAVVDEASVEKVTIEPKHLQISVTIYGEDYKLKSQPAEEEEEE